MIIFRVGNVDVFRPILNEKELKDRKSLVFFLDNRKNWGLALIGTLIAFLLTVLTFLGMYGEIIGNKSWEVIVISLLFLLAYSIKLLFLKKDEVKIETLGESPKFKIGVNVYFMEWFTTYISFSLLFTYISTLDASFLLVNICRLLSMVFALVSLMPFILTSVYVAKSSASKKV